MSCPFRAVFGRAAVSDDSAPGVCPFTGAKAGDGDGDAAASTARVDGDSNGHAPAPATCPFGFGGGKSKAGLTDLDCIKCRALLHEPVLLACGHRFCGACLPPTARDCLACGADVEGRAPDGVSAEKVEARLEAAAAAAASAAPSSPTAAAEAWLAAGVDSVAGGNPAAGLARLGRAEEEFRKAVGGGGGQPPATPAALAALAAVCGSQGDCWRAIGDVDAAAAAYGRAIAALEGGGGGDGGEGGGGAPAAKASLDLIHARAVTLSKLGDLQYTTAGPGVAARAYARALAARLGAAGEAVPAWAAAGGGAAPATAAVPTTADPAAAVALRVDAGLSAAKVGDALAASGDVEGGRAALALARSLVAKAKAAGGGGAGGVGGPAVAARLARLEAFLASSPPPA